MRLATATMLSEYPTFEASLTASELSFDGGHSETAGSSYMALSRLNGQRLIFKSIDNIDRTYVGLDGVKVYGWTDDGTIPAVSHLGADMLSLSVDDPSIEE